jgi:hypothetical protein
VEAFRDLGDGEELDLIVAVTATTTESSHFHIAVAGGLGSAVMFPPPLPRWPHAARLARPRLDLSGQIRAPSRVFPARSKIGHPSALSREIVGACSGR